MVVAMIALPAAVVVVLVLALAGGGSDSTSPGERAPGAASAARLRADRFDEERAFSLLRLQVEMGPRPAGSEASRRLAALLRARLPRGRYEAVPGGLRNVVGSIPGRRPAVVVAAHYDTKAMPGFVGANDGAGGTAAVVELARALRRAGRGPRAPEIRFVLFDGEEAPDDSRPFLVGGVRGARAYAARHGSDVRALVLLDFVAEKGEMRIPREAGSDPELWAGLRAAARRVGAQAAFPAGVVGEVLDDHTPFARRGIPAIDLIDFTFACWHQTCDDMGAVSMASLDMTGETVYELVRTLR
jgi:glutaminyl-peptide cyclotransferase